MLQNSLMWLVLLCFVGFVCLFLEKEKKSSAFYK